MYLLASSPSQPQATQLTCPAQAPQAARQATQTSSATYTLTRQASRTTRTA